jgi:LPS export ABC transporter permease LptG/LPS export ABC transporter permease LptF
MRIIDRYVIREVLWPFVIGLIVFTFILIIPFLIQYAEQFISKGVPALVVAQIMATLLPASLGLTIPMALLLGLLVGFGRLSADREFVAMQACGVSLLRLMRPVGLLSVLSYAATSYMLLVAMPNANQRFREITFSILASRAEGEVRPRVFFEDFPNLVLFVRDVPPGGGWKNVFMADTRAGQPSAIYLAEFGRVVLNRERRTVEMFLEKGARHTADGTGKYEVFRFEKLLLSVNPDTIFPREGPLKGVREMSIAELRARAAMVEASGNYPHTELFEIQKKFSIPAACLVFGLIGLALGATNRRDGKLASFVVGIGVIFAYYVLLWLGQSMVRGHIVPPWLAAWMPNVALGAFGLALVLWRKRAADRPVRFGWPGRWRLAASADLEGAAPLSRSFAATSRFGVWAGRAAMAIMPMPSILDRYVAMSYLRVLGLAALAMAGIFYISTFLDLSDKVFRGDATWLMMGEYFWYATPQFFYYILPLSVLLATLVTIGLLTKNSELVVMKACGISLYRVALPMLVAALCAGSLLFLIEESVLGPSNRRAEAIRHVMRGGLPQTFDVLERRWVLGTKGEIYHYEHFEPDQRRLDSVTVYGFDAGMQRLLRRTYADRATYLGGDGGAASDAWRIEQGWTREFNADGDSTAFNAFAESRMAIEPVDYFATEEPDPAYMRYAQLRSHIARLQDSGFDVVAHRVALERKISFPFVTLIMTLIAVPFAVTTGRRGAMYGIGVGIVIAISYWVAISVFAALGTGGLMTPLLAAWAPNLLFGTGAAYCLLTVRT